MFALAWIGLDRVGLDWIGLDWRGLGWGGLVWSWLDWIGLDWIGMDWIGFGWAGLGCAGLGRAGGKTKSLGQLGHLPANWEISGQSLLPSMRGAWGVGASLGEAARGAFLAACLGAVGGLPRRYACAHAFWPAGMLAGTFGEQGWGENRALRSKPGGKIDFRAV